MVATGTARYVASNIPEAIKYPRELSLVRPWLNTHGAHLTFVASEDFRQTATVVPSLPPLPAVKAELRRTLRAARKAFVQSLSAEERGELEASLADHLWPLVERASIVAGYSPRGSEIDPSPLLFRAGNAFKSVAYPAFTSAKAPMIFRSGQCAEDCPVGGVQPPHQAKEVRPDLVLVPLLAVDRSGNRLGQGGGHYDRALPALRDAGATIIGIGWAMQRLDRCLPAEPWDVPLDGFASPDGLELFQ